MTKISKSIKITSPYKLNNNLTKKEQVVKRAIARFKPKTLDYTWQGWGHAMYCFYADKKYGSWLSRYFDRRRNWRRYTALLISAVTPNTGDILTYTAEDRSLRYALITDVEWLRDPKDLYKVWFVINWKYKPSGNTIALPEGWKMTEKLLKEYGASTKEGV